MASDDELDARVTALEHQVRAAREDSAAARILARGADRDVSAMQATLRDHTATLNQHTATLNSHTATLNSHTATLDSHSAKLDMHKALLESLRETQVDHGRRLAALERTTSDGFAEMRQGFSMLAVGQAQLLALLGRPDDPEPAG